MRSARVRTALVAAAAAAAVGAVAPAPAPPAQAGVYRYWVYWHWTGSGWSYSQVGPDDYRVKDGAVDGWRFARSESSSSRLPPRAGADYAALCPGLPAEADGIQAAVIVDYGTEPDSPGGVEKARCVTLGSDTSGTGLLQRADYDLRFSSGRLLCAINDYPGGDECGQAVDDPKPAPTKTTGSPRAASPSPRHPGSERPSSTTSSTQPEAAARASAPTAGVTASAAAPPSSAQPPAEDSSDPSASAASPSLAAPSDDSSDSSPYGLLAGAALVLGLGGAALWRTRRSGPQR